MRRHDYYYYYYFTSDNILKISTNVIIKVTSTHEYAYDKRAYLY